MGMAKRRMVSEAEVIEGKVRALQGELVRAATNGNADDVVRIGNEIKVLKARGSAAAGNGLSPGERFVIKALELAKGDPEYQKNGWKGLAVNISPIPAYGFTINQGLRDLCGLKTREERVELTEGMVRRGLIEKVPFRYYTRSGQPKGSVRLYLTGDAPVSTEATVQDTSLEQFLNG
jgi:hypothetical protein